MLLIAAAIVVIYFSVITVKILSLLLGLLLSISVLLFSNVLFLGGLHCLHPVCGLSCPTTCGILVPHPGIEPMAPALEGGFLTTGPSGKSPGICSLN